VWVATRRGPGWFGPAYAEMMRHDPHAAGSIDRELIAEAVGLDARSSARLYRAPARPRSVYRRGTRPRLETLARSVTEGFADTESRVDAIARFTAGLSARAPTRGDDLRFGGTEEAIVARGSDWCSDVARVAAALAQVAGIPSRIVELADLDRPYSGHVVVEAFRRGRWGCVDPLCAVVYRDGRGLPASTWQLMRHPEWVRRHDRGAATPFARAGQFRRAAIAEYPLRPRNDRAYRTSRLNRYYRSVLDQAERGWPGGLRWLHGEDRSPTPRPPP
jgi:transglutaminase-like putative cysteine protease